MSRTSVLRILIILVIGAGACALVYYSPAFFIKEEKPPVTAAPLKTGGTSVVAIMMENRWRNAYRKERDAEVDYKSTGSTEGVKEMLEGNLAIAFTHAPLSEKQRRMADDKRGPVIQIPIVLCAVVPIYNVKELQGKPPLKFTGPVLADIFLGKIQRWDDPALKKLNEGVDLPDTPIVVVHREDSSGTTFLFTDYLQRVSDDWRNRFGAHSTIQWPVGVGKARNLGVKTHVAHTEGAIGYVDLIYALPDEVQYGAVENKDRSAFIHAAAPNMTAALRAQLADIPEDLTFDLTNKSGKDSYPICGVIWAVCYQDQPVSVYGRLVSFLQWATHDGQRFATTLAYAPLPEELVGRVEKKVKSVRISQ